MAGPIGPGVPCPAAIDLGLNEDGDHVYLGCMNPPGPHHGDMHEVEDELPVVFGGFGRGEATVTIRWRWPTDEIGGEPCGDLEPGDESLPLAITYDEPQRHVNP